MTKLQWDAVGSRKFETGCDRGVLYLNDGTAVVWNGITGVTDENAGVGIEPYYTDGVMYLARRSTGDYSGTLKALTYPDEFMEYDGTVEFSQGLFVTNQPVDLTFGLSYRTGLGNDINGIANGYRIHLLYNLLAKPDGLSFSSTASSVNPEEFSWALIGVPVVIPGYRPTVHYIIDSTKVPAGAMSIFEDYLYGTDGPDGSGGALPDPSSLVSMYSNLITEPLTDPI